MADEVVNTWPDRYLGEIGSELTPRDVVCVLTPSGAHADHSIAAARHALGCPAMPQAVPQPPAEPVRSRSPG